MKVKAEGGDHDRSGDPEAEEIALTVPRHHLCGAGGTVLSGATPVERHGAPA